VVFFFIFPDGVFRSNALVLIVPESSHGCFLLSLSQHALVRTLEIPNVPPFPNGGSP